MRCHTSSECFFVSGLADLRKTTSMPGHEFEIAIHAMKDSTNASKLIK